jgi:hypothetical protein
MPISINTPSLTQKDILRKVSDFDILHHYFNVTKIPCVISNPLREDKHPSLGLHSTDGIKIHYTDFANKTTGGVFDLLGKYWGVSYREVLKHLWEDLPNIVSTNSHITKSKSDIQTLKKYNSNIILKCKIRDWQSYDIKYWESYGISLKWLKYADVYPISHKIVIKDGRTYTFKADKLAYAYVEFKDGITTLKIYQPLNTNGFKWSNRHDKSVLSLWTKVPEYGDKICICSSLKDALCLWANCGIPSISTQGEGYSISKTAVNELKRRYKKIYILFDNDKPGLLDGEKLSKETGFINIVLPIVYGQKDISDLFKSLQNKIEFKSIMLDLFKD